MFDKKKSHAISVVLFLILVFYLMLSTQTFLCEFCVCQQSSNSNSSSSSPQMHKQQRQDTVCDVGIVVILLLYIFFSYLLTDTTFIKPPFLWAHNRDLSDIYASMCLYTSRTYDFVYLLYGYKFLVLFQNLYIPAHTQIFHNQLKCHKNCEILF